MDANSEAKLADLYPPFAEKIRTLAKMLETETTPIIIRVLIGLRSWAKQGELYAKGRDENGHIIDKEEVVTDAPAGYSWHQFGLAVDVGPDDPTLEGFQVDWNSDHPAWKRIIEISESLGLVSGSTFPHIRDFPHLQMTGAFGKTPDDEVRYLFREGGLEAVWKEAFKNFS